MLQLKCGTHYQRSGVASDADGCAAAIVDVSYEATYGPVLITNNDGGPQASEPTSKGGSFSPIAAHNTSLAAYLMAMNDESYFGSGYGPNIWQATVGEK